CGLAYGHVFLFVMAPPQARPTLVPYTTLFRSYFIPEYLRHFENAFVLVKGEYDEIFVFVDTHYPTIQFYTRRPGDSTCRILACRSEERRVGKECRSWGAPCAYKEKTVMNMCVP